MAEEFLKDFKRPGTAAYQGGMAKARQAMNGLSPGGIDKSMSVLAPQAANMGMQTQAQAQGGQLQSLMGVDDQANSMAISRAKLKFEADQEQKNTFDKIGYYTTAAMNIYGLSGMLSRRFGNKDYQKALDESTSPGDGELSVHQSQLKELEEMGPQTIQQPSVNNIGAGGDIISNKTITVANPKYDRARATELRDATTRREAALKKGGNVFDDMIDGAWSPLRMVGKIVPSLGNARKAELDARTEEAFTREATLRIERVFGDKELADMALTNNIVAGMADDLSTIIGLDTPNTEASPEMMKYYNSVKDILEYLSEKYPKTAAKFPTAGRAQ